MRNFAKHVCAAIMIVAIAAALVGGFVPAMAGGLNTFDGINYVELLMITNSATGSPVTNPAADGIDIRQYKGQATLIFQQAATNTVTTNTIAVFESDTTNGTYTAVSGATVTVTGKNDTMTAKKMDIQPRKRYLRAILTPAGTGSSQGALVLVTN